MGKKLLHVGARTTVRMLEGALLIVVCALGGFVITSVLGGYSVERGDVFIRTAVIAGSSILIIGTWWGRTRARSVSVMVGSLLLVEIPIVSLVIYFVGSYELDSVSLHWFLFANAPVALPWIVAAALAYTSLRQG